MGDGRRCTFDRPLRARRGFSASSRCADTSNAYSRPVLRMAAPIARALPPAPAQNRPPSRRAWHPAAGPALRALVLHLDGAAREGVQPCQRRLASMRKTPGEYGVAFALMPACASSFELIRACLQGVDAQIQRRRLRQAVNQRPKPSPSWAFSGSASHCGRLWRCGPAAPRGAPRRRHRPSPFSWCGERAFSEKSRRP